LLLRCGLRGGGGDSSLLLSGGLNVSGLAATPDGFSGSGSRRRSSNRFRSGGCGGGTATASRGWRGCGLFLGTCALLTLPSRADTRDLVVGEHRHVTANRNIH